MDTRKIVAAIIVIIVISYILVSGSRITGKKPSGAWYDCVRPQLSPPNYVFSIVWPILYILIAAAIIKTFFAGAAAGGTREVAVLYAINLALNLLWSYAFFAAQMPTLAFFIILAILGSLWKIWTKTGEKLRGEIWWMFAAYGGWLSFAAILNGQAIWNNYRKKCNVRAA